MIVRPIAPLGSRSTSRRQLAYSSPRRGITPPFRHSVHRQRTSCWRWMADLQDSPRASRPVSTRADGRSGRRGGNMRELGRAAVLSGIALTLIACGGTNGSDRDGGFDGQVSRRGADSGRSGGDAGHDAGHTAACTRDSDCDDGLYCTGVERCMPGASGAGADGCVAGTPPCDSSTQTCDETSSTCTDNACQLLRGRRRRRRRPPPRVWWPRLQRRRSNCLQHCPKRSVTQPASMKTAIRPPSTTTAQA